MITEFRATVSPVTALKATPRARRARWHRSRAPAPPRSGRATRPAAGRCAASTPGCCAHRRRTRAACPARRFPAPSSPAADPAASFRRRVARGKVMAPPKPSLNPKRMNSSACWRLPLKAWAIPPLTRMRRNCLRIASWARRMCNSTGKSKSRAIFKLFGEIEGLQRFIEIRDEEIQSDLPDGKGAIFQHRRAQCREILGTRAAGIHRMDSQRRQPG